MALPYAVATAFNVGRQRTQIFGPFETGTAFNQFLAGQRNANDYEICLVWGAPPAGAFSPNTPVAISVGQIIVVRYYVGPSAFDPQRQITLQMGYGPWDSHAAGQDWADSFTIADSFLNVVGPILAPPPPG